MTECFQLGADIFRLLPNRAFFGAIHNIVSPQNIPSMSHNFERPQNPVFVSAELRSGAAKNAYFTKCIIVFRSALNFIKKKHASTHHHIPHLDHMETNFSTSTQL